MKTVIQLLLIISLLSCTEENNEELVKAKKKIIELEELNDFKQLKISDLESDIQQLSPSNIKKENDSLTYVIEQLEEEVSTLKSGISSEDFFQFQINYLLPSSLLKSLEDLANQYKIIRHINPFFITGRFDEDDVKDYAILIEEINSKKKGIIILSGKDYKQFEVIGAGNSIGNGGDDFSWMDAWRSEKVSELKTNLGENELTSIKGQELISVIKTESASAILYWDGEAYKWYQLGD